MLNKATLWTLCTMCTLLVVAAAGIRMVVGGERELLLVGPTSDAHRQIEMACETCHAAPAFASVQAAAEALNETCRNCHEDELLAADDSHPRKLFRTPRMAVYRQQIDVLQCTTCHLEHRPEITRAGGVTVPREFCAACHSQGDQDVRAARASHATLTFDTCASAGCHNYHDNRALYEDFLATHGDDPWVAPTPVHRLSALRREARGARGERASATESAVAPPKALLGRVVDEWADSAHAASAVGCAACHAPGVAAVDVSPAVLAAQWIDAPDTTACADCHDYEATTFALGRHGMRQHPAIAEPRDPKQGLDAIGLQHVVPDALAKWIADVPLPTRMTVAEARLPMRDDPVSEVLDCGTCHQPHTVDVERAAVAACASCHDDAHSRAYFASAHYALWQADVAGAAAPGTGVSCATCHMAKARRRGTVVTSHNQNEILRPSTKMIRPVCLDCHGLRFAIDALADAELVARNFQGKPDVHVESVSWAIRRRNATH